MTSFIHLINTFCEELSTESSIIYFFLCANNSQAVATVHEWWQCTSSWLTHYEPLWTWVAAFGGAAGAWHESATEKPLVSDFFFSDILTSQTFSGFILTGCTFDSSVRSLDYTLLKNPPSQSLEKKGQKKEGESVMWDFTCNAAAVVS